MKKGVSSKDKILLFVLVIIAIGAAYYKFIYLPQTSKIQEKLKQENEIKERYTAANKTIDSMEDIKTNIKILKAKIVEKSSPFYPVISQEHIILELNTLLMDSGLNGSIKFEPIVSDSVESAEKKNQVLAESSLKPIAEKYNNIENNKTDTNDKTSTDNNVNGYGVNNSEVGNKENSNSKNSKDKKKYTIRYVKVQINFEGSYDGLNKFLNSIEKNERKIVVNTLKLSSADITNGIKGSMNLEIYSIPKLTNELENYLKWTLNNDYGRNVPFAAGTANVLTVIPIITSNTASTNALSKTDTSSKQNNKEPNDFIALVKPMSSDIPTIMLGKSNDSSRTSYVYADSNSEENVEMILTQDGDKYYYKYKTSKGSYPADYNGNGEAFIPASENIILKISTERRLNANDDSGINLKIINKTNRQVKVNISGDNSVNPRVEIDSSGGNVSINKD
jgi:General secretion pathway protein M.